MNISQLQEKKNKLEQIERTLKQEFFGIDKVIDQVVEHLQPWYFFNASQTHPLIINLWGLTGTGKTTLVNRLVELLDKERAFIRLEANKIKNHDAKEMLTAYTETYEDDDFIVCIDEFQHTKTLDKNGAELDTFSNFNLWDFLDTGQFDVNDKSYRNVNVYESYKFLQTWSKYGIVVNNGKIYFDKQPKNIISYIKNSFHTDDKDFTNYLDKHERLYIYKLFPERYNNMFEFDQYYFTLNEKQLQDLLFEAVYRRQISMIKKLNKSLIFVVGNLDEAYHMSKNFSPDLSADAFYKMSLQINLTDIKEALKSRFRNEQIARLGNNHIIYPALNKNAYQRVIQTYLDKVKQDIFKHYNIELSFNTSVHDVIYNNGVIPTQGVRPLLSSLKSLISARIGEVICHLAQKGIKADKINFSYSNKHYDLEYYKQKQLVSTLKLPVNLAFDDIKEKIPQNTLAATAIHEAGHAVINLCLLHDVPNEITAKTADSMINGYLSMDIKDKLITKQDVQFYVARLLAGLEAERLIFGEELITMGSSSDLKVVTRHVLRALSQNGFGHKLGYFAQKKFFSQYVLEEGLREIEQEAEQIINDAQILCRNTLETERQLLLAIADQLLIKEKLNPDDIKHLVKDYAVTFTLEELFMKASEKPHWERLKQELLSSNITSDKSIEKRKSA